jgi:hypothetical protein
MSGRSRLLPAVLAVDGTAAAAFLIGGAILGRSAGDAPGLLLGAGIAVLVLGMTVGGARPFALDQRNQFTMAAAGAFAEPTGSRDEWRWRTRLGGVLFLAAVLLLLEAAGLVLIRNAV